MKRKMLLSGCSHSAGFGLDDIKKSWGNIFAENNNCELTNVAHPGCSLQYSIQQIINKISEEEYDIIVLQLTDLGRYPLPFNGEDVFFSNNINNFNKEIPEVFHLNSVNYIQTDGSRKYVSGDNKLPISDEIIRFFYEKITYSSFYLNSIINDLYLIQQLLKYKGVDFILIPYDQHFWGNNTSMSIWKFEGSKKIDKTRYVDYPFMKWLIDNYDPSLYYSDSGFHLNEIGHKLFAEEYLPSFIKLNPIDYSNIQQNIEPILLEATDTDTVIEIENENIIFGIENYCTCKYHGENNIGTWFINLDKTPINNGFLIDRTIYDSEEIFDIEKEKEYFEVYYDDNIRYFKNLNMRTTFINHRSLYKNFKSVDDLIKSNDSFYFMIDCGDFPSIKNIIISEKILNLVNNNKCIIILNTSYEPVGVECGEYKYGLDLLVEKYNLNKKNLKILSGNLLSAQYNNEKYEFIPYCYFLENPWFIQKTAYMEDAFGEYNSKKLYKALVDKKEFFLQKNREITIFDKKILFYNRRPHSHRMYSFYHFYHNDIIRNNSYMSLNITIDNNSYNHLFYFTGISQEELSRINDFYKDKQCWSFDGKDLNINFSNNFEEDYHKKTFLSIVSETSAQNRIVFFSEKMFKPIYACQPFIILGNPLSLKKLKELGFKTFDKWWDESYDDEFNFIYRVKKIKDILIEISLKTDDELSKILIEMENVLSHNYEVFINYKDQLLINALSESQFNEEQSLSEQPLEEQSLYEPLDMTKLKNIKKLI